jgi:hypothetical protein
MLWKPLRGHLLFHYCTRNDSIRRSPTCSSVRFESWISSGLGKLHYCLWRKCEKVIISKIAHMGQGREQILKVTPANAGVCSNFAKTLTNRTVVARQGGPGRWGRRQPARPVLGIVWGSKKCPSPKLELRSRPVLLYLSVKDVGEVDN